MEIVWTDAGETGTITTKAQGQDDATTASLRLLAEDPKVPAEQRALIAAGLEAPAEGLVDVQAGEAFLQVVGVAGDGEPHLALMAELMVGDVSVEVSISGRGKPIDHAHLRALLDKLVGAL